MKSLPEWARIAIKAVAFLPVFLVLHYAYQWLPWAGLAWFSSTGEAVYQHMKISFFAYGVLCGLEYLLARPVDRQRFVDARLLAAILVPWGIFFGWYIAPALYGGPLPSDALEIVYANVITLGVLGMVGVIERSLEGFAFPRRLRAVLWVMAGILVVEFVIFTYRAPWADVFTVPPGW